MNQVSLKSLLTDLLREKSQGIEHLGGERPL